MIGFASDDILDLLRPSIFRVQTNWNGGGAVATAFAVARLEKSNRLVLATAAHVLDFPPAERVNWLVQQFDANEKIERHLVAETCGADSPEFAYRWHKQFDVGIFVLPPEMPDGRPFARPNETPVHLCPEMLMPGAGTRVAWAGFSGEIEGYAQHPHLCYFEGVICATVNEANKHLYIVDGHSARGVSGGPLWVWSTERKRAEVIGIMSKYKQAANYLPGFCIFEPIEFIRQYLIWWNQQMAVCKATAAT